MTWRDIPDSEISARSLLRQSTLRTLRDNVNAALRGDADAPRKYPANFEQLGAGDQRRFEIADSFSHANPLSHLRIGSVQIFQDRRVRVSVEARADQATNPGSQVGVDILKNGSAVIGWGVRTTDWQTFEFDVPVSAGDVISWSLASDYFQGGTVTVTARNLRISTEGQNIWPFDHPPGGRYYFGVNPRGRAQWFDITDAETGQDKPLTSRIMFGLRDNLIAAFEDQGPQKLHTHALPDIAAGDNIRFERAGPVLVTTTGWQEMGGLRVYQSGTVRVGLQHRNPDGGGFPTSARVRRNGTVVATWSTGSSSYQTRAVDVPVSAGDEITAELNITVAGRRAQGRNFRVMTDDAPLFPFSGVEGFVL